MVKKGFIIFDSYFYNPTLPFWSTKSLTSQATPFRDEGFRVDLLFLFC